MIAEGIRLTAATCCMAAGVVVMGIAIAGIFRVGFVLNRMHIAAICDTLGLLLILLGLILLCGWSATSLKLLLILVFVWLANPVSSHMICRLETETNPDIGKECEVVHYEDP